MLASFYTGKGGIDIAKKMISGISRGSSWERNFSRGSPVVAKVIHTVFSDIILEALKDEINVTVYKQLKDKLSQNQINEFLTQFRITQIISPGIGNISISVKGTRRSYDSLGMLVY